MTTLQMPQLYEASRTHSQQSLHSSSPIASPRPPRPQSQMSLHLTPVGGGNGTFSPVLPPDSATPLGSYHAHSHAQPLRHITPTPTNLSFPNPVTNPDSNAAYPSLPYYPVYDARPTSQPMMRTISYAHQLHSAGDQTTTTASPRYSTSPQSAGGMVQQSPPTATFQHQQPQPSYQAPSLQPVTHYSESVERHHINPSLFNPAHNHNNAHQGANDAYPMSRSTSGASASDAGNDYHRLLTPHYEYRNFSPSLANNSNLDNDVRKVSDPMSFTMQPGRHRFYPQSAAPNYAVNEHGIGLGLGPHRQPHGDVYFRNASGGDGAFGGDHYVMSSERGEQKPNVGMMPFGMGLDTEYERQREAQIMNNRKLLEEVGLSGQTTFRPRDASGTGDRRRKQVSHKKRLLHDTPSRSSPRIASRGSISYTDLDGGPGDRHSHTSSEESYASDPEYEDEDDFRPVKRSKGQGVYGRKSYAPAKSSRKHKADLSLWGLLQPYPEIPHLFPLFYYTLNNDLSINPDSVPLIGSIPSTCTPLEKAETLRSYFHRGRRVLAQLDSFTNRCDRKYEGPEDKWVEMDYHTRIAIRDVRRKVVERCENYKYTRRDILDKILGKNKWQPIEQGMISWDPSSGNNDPANDLANVTLTLPTPPPSAYHTQSQMQAPAQPPHSSQSRSFKSLPSRARMASHRIDPIPSPRIMSVNMSLSASPMPEYQSHHQHQQYSSSTPMPYSAYTTPLPPPPPPMFGEDEVPMTVQMPGSLVSSPLGVGNASASIPTAGLPGSAGSAPGSQNQSESQSHIQNGQQINHGNSSPIGGDGSWSDGYTA